LALAALSQGKGEGERRSMDMTWVTNRIAVGGGIWTDEKMIEVVRAGVTHVIDMQIEFDDTALADPYGVKVLWNPTDDDFQPKPAELFRRGVDFALEALDDAESRVFIHCAAGVHRAPMMALALLRALGFSREDAIDMIQSRRNVVDFADVYVESVEEYIRRHHPGEQSRVAGTRHGNGAGRAE
jgi:protein-tyrosine phosphatase